MVPALSEIRVDDQTPLSCLRTPHLTVIHDSEQQQDRMMKDTVLFFTIFHLSSVFSSSHSLYYLSAIQP
jgi:hypothetical protein